MGSIRVVGFGAMNLDQLYRVQSVLADNETPIKEHKSSPGGSAANTIYGLAKLGVSTGFIGAVGSDKEGESLLDDFNSVGTDCSQIKIKDVAKTGSVLGLTDSYGKRALYVSPGANNLLKKEDINLEYIAKAELIHLSSFVNDEQFDLQKWVANNTPPSVKISFTPGAIYTRKGLNALNPLLSKTDILFVNENEIVELTGTNFRAAARFFLDRGCKIVIVTRGEGKPQRTNKLQLMLEFNKRQDLPSYAINNNNIVNSNEVELLRFPSYVADANKAYVIESQPGYGKDTTGAGDAFAAGFLYGVVNNKGLEECGRLGDIVAKFSITKIGARQGLPTLSELAQRYRELYAKG